MKLSLAVYGSFLGGKPFSVLFHRFDKKNCFHQIKIFLSICPFSNLLKKDNFLSNSKLLIERFTFFDPKEKFSINFRENASKL